MTPPSPHILLLVSNPLDAPIDIRHDLAKLSEALHELPAATIVTQIAEANAVGERLALVNRPLFPVLHYLGHGYQPASGQAGLLFFEDANGTARPLDRNLLRTLLFPTSGTPEFQLAILSACHSQSVAQAFFDIGVRHVVAIEGDKSVYEIAAVRFFGRFYRTLLTGGTLRAAFEAGRRAVLTDEELAKLGKDAAQDEAAKFLLLPELANHDIVLFAPGQSAAGEAQLVPLPSPHHPLLLNRPAHFFGRSDDMLAAIRQLRGPRRALLVKGVSGVGKSALSIELAYRLVERGLALPDRAYFIALVNAHSADDVRREIARSLRIPVDSLPHEPLAANAELAQQLPKRALLILDEAENAIHAGGLAVRTLLESLAQSPHRPLLIVTSQSDMGSAFFPVLPLERLTPQAAVALLLQSVDPSRRPPLLAADNQSLIALLDMVDRVPRAIVLTAGVWNYLGSSDLAGLLADLQSRREQVMSDPRYPDEVKSVTVGVQLAWERLRQRNTAAAEFYPLLALFPGGLAEAGLPAIFGQPASGWLAAIEDQSLVERPFANLVYLPAPFRFFAERHLPGAVAAVRKQWGAATLGFYYHLDDNSAGWVEELNSDLTHAGEAMGAVIARYATELPSFEAWLEWGYVHEVCTPGQSRSARLTALLQNLYVVTNELLNRRSYFERALNAALSCADRSGEANVLQALGDLALREDKLGEASQRYAAALAIYPQIGDKLGEANIYQSLGRLALRENDAQAAFDFYRKALEIHVAIGDQFSMGADFGYMAQAAAAAQSFVQAIMLAEESLMLHRRIGEQMGQAFNLDDQGNWLNQIEEEQAALGAWWQALAIAQRIGLPQAQRLQGIFAQVAQNAGEGWPQLQADLNAHAEAWRLAGVAAARSALAGVEG